MPLFTVTLFLSAALVFLVQPMFAKMVLPLLGGSPSTWITSLLFFQVALLAGYAYAHWSTRWLGTRRQLVLHGLLVAAAVVALPVAVPHGWTPPVTGDPVPWLLSVLVVAVGLPFFVVSSTSPLLQRWFSTTHHAGAEDPYFLYRASNLGSMLALLAYPAVVEPRLRLADQGRLWAGGYLFLAGLTVVCAVSGRRARPGQGIEAEPDAAPEEEPAERLGAGRRARWVALAFVPSSFMLAVTSYVTTDIAAVPLLWVVPLALYLLSFVAVFSRRPFTLFGLMVQVQPFLVIELVLFLLLEVSDPVVLVMAIHLLAMFVSAVVCHGRLAADRPPATRLTEFYLWVALGGALGGLFNAVLAPLLFDSVVEYPLAIVAACLLRPPRARGAADADRAMDVMGPAAAGVLAVFVVALGRVLGLDAVTAKLLAVVPALLLCATFAGRPVRFGLGVAAVLVAGSIPPAAGAPALYADRSFFGVLRVEADDAGVHRLVHGNTTHGAQSTRPDRRLEPLTYFHRTGPAGQVFDSVPAAATAPRVAVIGLGTGSLACHGRAGQRWTFYEIDPAVEQVARDPRLFTFLRDCPPATDVVLGDARLSLSRSSGQRFGVIVLDAFNSDAIPVHLLTRQALALYLDRLADGGVIAMHVTNRYLDLRPVVGDLARDAHLASLVREDVELTRAEREAGKAGSVWVVLARRPADLGPLAGDSRWSPPPRRPGSRVWTDDFSNLLAAFKRGQ